MPFANSDGLKIYYNDMGHGEPAILYLTGWCDSRNSFNQFTFSCAKNRRVIALDWRGHGKSDKPASDFGFKELTDDALAVLQQSKINSFIPVAKANGGWTAIELKRLLPDRIPKMVFIDWHLFNPPITYLNLIESLQNNAEYKNARNKLFEMWLKDVDNTDVIRLIRNEMSSYGFDMWKRASRAISRSYKSYGSPLNLLTSLKPEIPVMHLYSQPEEHAYLISQENFSASHEWFKVRRLNLKSHFLTIEVPELASSIIEQFISEEQMKATGT
jgi:pimeloyl-ACP methyl ester carboxylesterase